MRVHIAAVGVLLGALSACGGGDAEPEPKPSKVAQGPAVPSPDADQTAKLMASLKAIDAGLAADQDRAVGRSRNVCLDLKQGGDAVANARARFEGGSVPKLTESQAAKIVDAVKASFCA